MIRDVPGQEDEAALEWGVDFGLDDGEALPNDVEQLTEAQYTLFMMAQTLRGTFEELKADELKGEKGSGVIVPR